MVRKLYKGPIIRTLEDGGQGEIIIGPSQGTSGFDSRWTFSGIDQGTLDMIDLNCDDFNLQDMDTSGDYIITKAEFDAWFALYDNDWNNVQ
ncbi:MAG: hypothetical protein IJG05_00230 [Solobacterium sp.]|nr:hypothetical protein [Solobacterium sp.]